jgi:NAD-dependent SIR2 family protein deacetylase
VGLYDMIRASPTITSMISEPQELFDYQVFLESPHVFASVGRILYGSLLQAGDSARPAGPSLTHRFIAALHARGALLRNYTQNIDGLEAKAGLTEATDAVVQCHGSLATASCVRCGHRVPGAALLPFLRRSEVVRCTATAACAKDRRCALVKPDVTFFREPLPRRFLDRVDADCRAADLLLCMGTALKVKPVADIPAWVPAHVPTVLINRESVRIGSSSGSDRRVWTAELLGDCDAVCRALWSRLQRLHGWEPDAADQEATDAVLAEGSSSDGIVFAPAATPVAAAATAAVGIDELLRRTALPPRAEGECDPCATLVGDRVIGAIGHSMPRNAAPVTEGTATEGKGADGAVSARKSRTGRTLHDPSARFGADFIYLPDTGQDEAPIRKRRRRGI